MFRLLRGFRHDLDTHKMCFHAIANILEKNENRNFPFSIREELDAFDAVYATASQRHHDAAV